MNNTAAYNRGYEFGQNIGMWLFSLGIIAFVIWVIWALIKYKPFSHFVKVSYDVRYFVVQVVLMYSNKPSIFSIKRFHNGLITYWAIITASLYIRHTPALSAEGLVIIMLPLLAVGGYNIYQSQQDKKIKQEGGLIDKAIDNATDIANKMADKSEDKS